MNYLNVFNDIEYYLYIIVTLIVRIMYDNFYYFFFLATYKRNGVKCFHVYSVILLISLLLFRNLKEKYKQDNQLLKCRKIVNLVVIKINQSSFSRKRRIYINKISFSDDGIERRSSKMFYNRFFSKNVLFHGYEIILKIKY